MDSDKLPQGVIGYDHDGEEIREPRADAPIWLIQIKKLERKAAQEGHAPRATYVVVEELVDQPWGPPDLALLSHHGIGHYEWKMRTGQGWPGGREPHYPKKGEFEGVPETYQLTGRFAMSASDVARYSLEPVEEAPPQVLVGTPAAEPSTPAQTQAPGAIQPDQLAQAVAAAVTAIQQPHGQDMTGTIASTMATVLGQQRNTDTAASVSAMAVQIAAKAEAAALATLRGEFDKFENYTREQLKKVDDWGRDLSDLEKAFAKLKTKIETEGKRDLTTELKQMEDVAKLLGMTRESQPGPATVGRTGLDVGAELGGNALTILESLAEKAGLTSDDPFNKDGGAMDWAKFQGGKYTHAGPVLKRFLDDMGGDANLPLSYLVRDAIMRLHRYPVECQAVIDLTADDVKTLAIKSVGKSHPVVANWGAETVELVDAFKAMFEVRLAAFRVEEAKAKDKHDAEAKAGAGGDPGNNGGDSGGSAPGGKQPDDKTPAGVSGSGASAGGDGAG